MKANPPTLKLRRTYIYQPIIKVQGQTFTIFKDPDGFFAQCNEIPHCVAYATTKQELWRSIRKSLELVNKEGL